MIFASYGTLYELNELIIRRNYENLTHLRDANPLYSGFWRAFLHVFGTEGEGWLQNSFSKNGAKVTLGSYLRMLNLKGNHRKAMATE